MGHLRFIIENRRFLAFGLLLTTFSSFGQTYFISLFGGEIRTTFDLSHGDFGAVYALATLASGTSLIWLGRKIDDFDLRVYSVCVCTALVAACLFMSLVWSVVALGLAIFTLRLTGQGLMSHTAMTSMARYFTERRGMAISFATLGHAVGEGFLPLTTVMLMAAIGWRQTWLAAALFIFCVLIPLVLWVLKDHGARHRRHLVRITELAAAAVTRRQWSRRDMLRDKRFYLVLPAVLAPAFILTGLTFHQVHLVDSKGWTLAWFATGFMVYAATTTVSALTAGALIDHTSATRLVRFHLLPLAAGLMVLAAFDNPYTAFVYMALAGITMGANFSLIAALWAEVYGVAHLGSIRSLTSALAIFATALAPPVMGWLIDAGVSIETVALLCTIYVIGATALIGFAFPARRVAPATP